jgi:hypothetical protein
MAVTLFRSTAGFLTKWRDPSKPSSSPSKAMKSRLLFGAGLREAK